LLLGGIRQPLTPRFGWNRFGLVLMAFLLMRAREGPV
jgi:hypothetical protein